MEEGEGGNLAKHSRYAVGRLATHRAHQDVPGCAVRGIKAAISDTHHIHERSESNVNRREQGHYTSHC